MSAVIDRMSPKTDFQDDRSHRHERHLPTPRSLSPASESGELGELLASNKPLPGQTSGTLEPLSALRKGETDANQVAGSDVPMLQPTPVRPDKPRVLKLTQAQMYDLSSTSESIPIKKEELSPPILDPLVDGPNSEYHTPKGSRTPSARQTKPNGSPPGMASGTAASDLGIKPTRPTLGSRATSPLVTLRRNTVSGQRAVHTSSDSRHALNARTRENNRSAGPVPDTFGQPHRHDSRPSSVIKSLPLPPLSLPTYLHLELSSDRPSPLFVQRDPADDLPYESSTVKFERLLNFLLLPHQLERVLLFGSLACLDAWLYNFTILPLRFVRAVGLLGQWWLQTFAREIRDLCLYVSMGLGRFMSRRRTVKETVGRSPRLDRDALKQNDAIEHRSPDQQIRSPPRKTQDRAAGRHRRTGSIPSALLPNHKHDILHGMLIIISCGILVRFDASRMYHSIRGQAAIKLYVIYNVLEVGDRLLSALGQDVLECLFSKETLERKPNGRSKVIRPFWMFILALAYNVIHATMLFYQVITLNVAVNSYSNALLTLLMSNQFVEIRGTVFKKFEKENLFQLVCADVVERFQLWLMLLIIALRNIAEAGGLSLGGSLGSLASTSATASHGATEVQRDSSAAATLLPKAFTLIPKFTGQVLGPFLIVLGSEMLVDWLKHAYINKFNAVKPTIYARFLDVLAKDYYSHAFVDQNLTKRIGLPVLPLSCLFMRAAVQTYHMFLAAHVPPPLAPSVATMTSTAVDSVRESSAATTAALARIDVIIRRALGSSSFGGGAPDSSWMWSADDLIALTTMVLFFSILYLFLLAFKLVLGMMLLQFARSRYKGMLRREEAKYEVESRRLGPWGAIEMRDETRRIVNEEETNAGTGKRDQGKSGKGKRDVSLDTVGRYMMVAKRIW